MSPAASTSSTFPRPVSWLNATVIPEIPLMKASITSWEGVLRP